VLSHVHRFVIVIDGVLLTAKWTDINIEFRDFAMAVFAIRHNVTRIV